MTERTVPGSVLEQGCLRLIDEVAETHHEIAITKRGKPLPKRVPVMPGGRTVSTFLRMPGLRLIETMG